MTFRLASPYFLLLLLALPVYAWYRSRRVMQPVLQVPSIAHFSDLATPSLFVARVLLPFIKWSALLLMIVALSRPQWGSQKMNILTQGINIILAVDTSESMAALDFKQDGKVVNRLEAVKSVVRDFIAKRNGDRIGMVVFGSEAYTQLPLSRDYNAISTILKKLEIGMAGKSTAIGDAVGISLKRLEDIKSKSNVIILLTDGRGNSGEIEPSIAARIAKEKGVKIYTIGVGSKGKVPFLITDPLMGRRVIYRRVDIDEQTLKEMAAETGGAYFRATDTEALRKIYDTIDKLEKTKVKVTTYADYHDLYPNFLLTAFCLLIIWMILANTRYLTVP